MRKGLKWQALPLVIVSVCALIILAPSGVKAIRSPAAPVSISTVSYDFALLPVPFKVNESLSNQSPARTHTLISSAPLKHAITSSTIHRYSISSLYVFSKHANDFNSVFRKAFQQACLLLDVPPPSGMIS